MPTTGLWRGCRRRGRRSLCRMERCTRCIARAGMAACEKVVRPKLKGNEYHKGRHEEMFECYRGLIALRRGSDYLNNGEPGQTKVIFDEEKEWLVMERGAVTVVCNLGQERMEFENPKHLPL